jgi:ornithine cyclodeaminase/alanine dehydrogenase-like protein (mu-crystallin family)
MSVRLIRDADVRAVADVPSAVDAVQAAVIEAGRTEAPRSRARIAFPAGGWLRVMTGALPDTDVVGYKAFHLIAGGDIRYLIALYRLSTGEALALIDASHITALRTSATAAAAARAFWRDRPVRVGVVGSGALAQSGLRVLAAACEVTGARVFSPRETSRTACAEALGAELGIDVEPVAEPAAAAAGADMLLCATQTRGKVAVRAADLDASVRYVSSISSTLPSQRELDADVFAAVDEVVVDTPDVLDESGDALAALDAGTLRAQDARELWEFLDRTHGDSPRACTLYKSIGSVEQDLGLAALVHRRCEERGLGEAVEEIELARFIG